MPFFHNDKKLPIKISKTKFQLINNVLKKPSYPKVFFQSTTTKTYSILSYFPEKKTGLLYVHGLTHLPNILERINFQQGYLMLLLKVVMRNGFVLCIYADK